MKSDTPKPDGYRIISLYAQNIKRLSAVEIRPDGALVEVTGRNGQGKTSVLDCISWAIEGLSAIQGRPIREGWGSALIELDLGPIKITRTFERSDKTDRGFTTSLKIEAQDGSRYGKPQQVLDTLFGQLSLDPLAFMRMKPKDQLEAMRRFVPGVDFDSLQREHDADFQERTGVGRLADQEKAAYAAIVLPAGDHKPVDVTALLKALADAESHNTTLSTRSTRRAEAAREIEQLETEAEQLHAQARSKEARAAELQAKLDAAEALPEAIDTAAIRSQIADAEAINRLAQQQRAREQHREAFRQHSERRDALTASIAERLERKRKAIADAKMPIEGLGLGDDGVILNGLPLEQASDAEQLRTSIAIAMAMNEQLRVIRVHEGSLLDRASLALVREMAEARGYQVWIERVSDDGKVGVLIEDGTVRAIEGKRVTAK